MTTSPTNPFLYSVEREYAAPMAQVWKAWIDASQLEQWYHPTELANVPGSCVSEPDVGGWWTIAVDVPEHSIVSYFWGKYTVVEEHRQLQHTMCYSQEHQEFEARDLAGAIAEIVVDFEQRGESVWVRFAQYGFLPEEQVPLARAGMESYFQSLANFLQAE